MITLAAFDIAGTTVDDHGLVYDALRDCITAEGHDVTEDALTQHMGTEKHDAIRSLLRAADAPAQDSDVDRHYQRFVDLLGRYYDDNPPVPVTGVEEAMSTLRASGVKVVLTTGFSTDITRLVLSRVGWSVGEQLDGVVCADEVAAGRPAPYLVHRAMERTGTLDVREVMTAGDTIADLVAGTRSGATVVAGVLTGGVARDVLVRHPHTHLLDSVVDTVEIALAAR